jgi:predicted transposase/invertase (TIGR01784 family)
MVLGVRATVDLVFKKIFGSREHAWLTLSFLNAVLAEIGRPLARSVDILNPYEAGLFEASKDSVLDIKAEDEGGRTFQVEMQVRAYELLPRRMLGNWASLYSGQLAKGQSEGEHLPVVAIWLVGAGFLNESSWIEAYVARGERSGSALHDDFLIVAIDLRRWHRLRRASETANLESGLDRWLYLITESQRIDPQSPPEPLSRAEYEEAIEIMAVFTKKELERDRYQARLEFQRMMNDLNREAREARGKGFSEGVAKGKAESSAAIARRLRARGFPDNEIAEVTGLTPEELQSLDT